MEAARYDVSLVEEAAFGATRTPATLSQPLPARLVGEGIPCLASLLVVGSEADPFIVPGAVSVVIYRGAAT